jgi:hypothetical protein
MCTGLWVVGRRASSAANNGGEIMVSGEGIPSPGDTPIDDGRNEKATRVAAQLQGLEQMDNGTLRREWRRLFRAHPPKRVRRELLMLGVAWKIQAEAYGGLSAATRRRLRGLSKALERDGAIGRERVTHLKPGATLIREWHSVTHAVVVLEDGFEWKGRTWRSLSAIAREITGARWSGPRFFGLNGRPENPIGSGTTETSDA